MEERTIKELEKKIKEEGNLHIFSYKGIIGLIMRPHLVKKIYDDWKRKLIHWCGYALIPAETPLGKWILENKDKIEMEVKVHGGITLIEEEDGIVWIGFDTAHWGDISFLGDTHAYPTYKDKEYVLSETKKLIDEILRLYSGIKFVGGDA